MRTLKDDKPLSPETIGEFIRVKRMEEGLSIAKVAEKAGVTKKTVIDIEAGLSSSKYETLDRILRAVGYRFAVTSTTQKRMDKAKEKKLRERKELAEIELRNKKYKYY